MTTLDSLVQASVEEFQDKLPLHALSDWAEENRMDRQEAFRLVLTQREKMLERISGGIIKYRGLCKVRHCDTPEQCIPITTEVLNQAHEYGGVSRWERGYYAQILE